MKRPYMIAYVSKTDALSKVGAVMEKLSVIGSYQEIVRSIKSNVGILFPDKEGLDARAIRDEIRSVIKPFTESVIVVGINDLDYAMTDNQGESTFSRKVGDEGDEPRNFSRFSDMREARLAYQRENPKWVNPDGSGVAMDIDFLDWCWLPVRKDGIYERNGKYDKYLN